MALGNITVRTAVAQAPTYPAVEGVGLFVGASTTQPAGVQSLGRTTPLTAFGAAGAHPLLPALKAARANGGPNWSGYGLGLAPNTSLDALLSKVKETLGNFDAEFVVLCTPLASQAEIGKVETAMAAVSINGTRVFALCSILKPNHTEGQGAHADWAAYITAAKAVTGAAAAPRIVCVAPVFGNELGALAGRLQKVLDEPQARINRSPMRVASGAVKGMGTERSAVVDKTGVPLTLEHQKELDTARLSVFQWYGGQQGIYFADGNTLASSAGTEPKVVEHLRVLDKAARRVHLRGVQKIADDLVENTHGGNAAFATALGGPLRQMVDAGEIKPLGEEAIAITWANDTTVTVAITIQPPNAPKQITVEITLKAT